MRQPVKMIDVYQKLKKAIEDGVYPAGSFLPRETVLAQNLGIARGTLRSVLTRLAEEKFIDRMSSKGTMVCGRGHNKRQIPLTFLLPCADYISETFSEDVSAQYTRRILKGFSQVAFEYDYRVESVPVSPTNNTHDIDWRKLDFVNADSRVVVIGEWYRDLFPLLLERGCRVAFVDTHITPRKEYENFVNSSFHIIINAWEAAETAVGHLFRHGCHRIALFQRFISEPEHPTMGGYLAGLRRYGLAFKAWHELPADHLELQSLKSLLKDFYKKSGSFDGLIMSPDVILDLRLHDPQELGLPDNVKVVIAGDFGNDRWVTPQLTSIEFPYEDIGRVAARHLLASEFYTGKQLISGRLIERESTSAFSRKEQLVSV